MSIKEQLYQQCREHFQAAINIAEAAIASARESSQNETKSSAGDKYETAREMMQQEIDMNTARLNNAKSLLNKLETIDISKTYTTAIPGSLVHTNNGNFFIAVSAGSFMAGNDKYYAISIESPIGNSMMGKQQGNTFSVNAKEYLIIQIS